MLFHCAKCGAELTPDLTRLPELPIPDPDHRDRAHHAPPTVPRGAWALVPDSDDPRAPGVPRAAPGVRVLHPEDVPTLRERGHGRNLEGCCGPHGGNGPNLACPCGSLVATLLADCLGPWEVRLRPLRTWAHDPTGA